MGIMQSLVEKRALTERDWMRGTILWGLPVR